VKAKAKSKRKRDEAELDSLQQAAEVAASSVKAEAKKAKKAAKKAAAKSITADANSGDCVIQTTICGSSSARYMLHTYTVNVL
jgi:uncharacterized protein with PIN domain